METWKQIEGEKYEISNIGRVRRCEPGINTHPGYILKPFSSRGYFYVRLNGAPNLKPRSKTIHSLVAHTFLGPRPPGMEVNHKDGDKSHNAVENLEYVTPSANVRHAILSGLRPSGSAIPSAKLTESQVLEIRKKYANGEAGHKRLAKFYGVCEKTIRKIVKFKTWKHRAANLPLMEKIRIHGRAQGLAE